ncbi:hypothetical protein HXZ65_01540 [Acinetobacter indicus]|uniref:hypothetical protein n=1 Tax=Acinetobacter indicus TaxID=756892 RepID=UPI000CEC442A|nr:hypothetical protein [Acinetobacter indicus]MDM1276964.1 hypothetical protein [Acinetobacter indicus]
MKLNSFERSQTGATLIVVLVMLVLLMLVGLWAIRGSITALKISTNAQVVSLLKQTSDSVFFTLENKTDDELTFTNMRIGDGMLNYTLRPENKGKELVFCIRGETVDNFAGSRIASVIYWQSSTINNSEMGKNGFCQVNRIGDFLSGRNAVITQVSVRAAEGDRDWEHYMEGDDKETSKSTGIQKVVITATSLIPKLSNSSDDEINTCLSEYTSFRDRVVQNDTVTDCLASLNVPYSTQEMEYTMKPVRAS